LKSKEDAMTQTNIKILAAMVLALAACGSTTKHPKSGLGDNGTDVP
jgi:hypothetical protein